MTTLGKILVFLVFLGALAMGGLMIYVAKATPNWKAAVEERDKYIEVLRQNVKAESDSRVKVVNDFEKMKQLLDASLIEARTYRHKGHSRLDTGERYRPSEEVEHWLAQDPLPRAAALLSACLAAACYDRFGVESAIVVAREAVIALAAAIGLRGIDAGVLANSVAAEALTAVLIGINRRYKSDGAGIRITGLPDAAA